MDNSKRKTTGVRSQLNRRILIADDEQSFLKSSANLFEKKGYDCDCAVDAWSAVRLLEKNHYDVVVSDIRMPGNSGLRLAQEVARLQKGVPVVLVTGYPSLDTAKKAVGLPVEAYVEKPVEFNDLLFEVDSAILKTRERFNSANDPNCRTGQCERLNEMVGEISHAVECLKSTKRSFQSKVLGRLRERLEAVVKNHWSRKNGKIH
jgi:DNA-binding NtrC family response regulator